MAKLLKYMETAKNNSTKNDLLYFCFSDSKMSICYSESDYINMEGIFEKYDMNLISAVYKNGNDVTTEIKNNIQDRINYNMIAINECIMESIKENMPIGLSILIRKYTNFALNRQLAVTPIIRIATNNMETLCYFFQIK